MEASGVFPVVFSIGPFSLYTYGVFLVIALLVGLFAVWKRGRELYFDEEELFDGLFVILLTMLVAARLGYVMVRFDVYGFQLFDWVNVIGKPGLLFEAGLVGGVLAAIYQAKKRKWDIFLLGDVLTPALVLALAIVAMGAFLNGSGYGLGTESWLGMRFPGLYEKRYPVQLLEMVIYCGLFVFLWRAEKFYRTICWYKGSRSEARAGFITAVYFIGQGFTGLFTSVLKEGIKLWSFRFDQLFYLGVFLVGWGILFYRSELKVGEKWRERMTKTEGSKSGKVSRWRRGPGNQRGKRHLDQGIFS